MTGLRAIMRKKEAVSLDSARGRMLGMLVETGCIQE